MLAEIVLPHGTNKIAIRDIPELFADAIFPPVPEGTPNQITELRKFPLTKKNAAAWCGRDCAPFRVSLTDADFADLSASVWGQLAPLTLPIDAPKWEPYRLAFEATPPAGWRLEVMHKTPEIYQMVMHHTTKDDYLGQVLNAAMHGTLKPLSSTNYSPMPGAIGELLMDCIVTLENFTTFANSLQFGVTVKTSQLPVFQIQARPLFVPPELEAMNPTAQVRFIDRVGTMHGDGIVTAGDLLEAIRATISRQAAGYFTIDEASQILSDATGMPAKNQLEKLLRAIDKKTIHALDQGDKMPVLDTVRNYASVLRDSDMVAAGFAFPIASQSAPAQATATPAPVVPEQGNVLETVEQRRDRYLEWLTEEEKISKRGALQRVFEREQKENPKADRANIGKDIKKAREARTERKRAGHWEAQLVQDGNRPK